MESNNLHDLMGPEEIAQYHKAATVDWTDPQLSMITRLRLVSDPSFPFWDLSYCWGILKDGTKVKVAVPLYQVPKNNVKGFIIEQAKKDGVFAKGLGIFEAISYLQ